MCITGIGNLKYCAIDLGGWYFSRYLLNVRKEGNVVITSKTF